MTDDNPYVALVQEARVAKIADYYDDLRRQPGPPRIWFEGHEPEDLPLGHYICIRRDGSVVVGLSGGNISGLRASLHAEGASETDIADQGNFAEGLRQLLFLVRNGLYFTQHAVPGDLTRNRHPHSPPRPLEDPLRSTVS